MNRINLSETRNMTMLMDFYELTMSNGYLNNDLGNKIVYFDVFFRKVPEKGGFAIMAGLQQVIEYIKGLRFEEADINYLRNLEIFKEEFLEYLINFKFTGDIYSFEEGTPIFPNEPILTVKAPVIEAQLIETMILLTLNHQCLIATKANRIVRAANGHGVMEFGARRAQGYDGAIYGARAAYIGGALGTATALAGELFDIPVFGTMAHSWVQLFENEYLAFKTYAENYPDACTLLVDTYSVLESGIPNAIKVAKEVLEPRGYRLKGVRLDSGDMAYLSRKARKMLDSQGMTDCKIVASNSLDEYTITSLFNQGAKIDLFGVGERLVTSKAEPVFGGVYKLVAVENNEGVAEARIKISENPEKVSNPGHKKVYRFFDKYSNKALCDVITLANETIEENKPYTIFHPVHIWKKKKLTNFYIKELQVPVFINGELVYESPNLKTIRERCLREVDTLWDEIKRFENPHTYYVDLSSDLWNLKDELIKKLSVKPTN
ncbi:nicotinate phosphoribosyltransferase [Clostridium chauvoei]|uniref:Nicotinate phosphoribosyltransferase n=2 Tax=Clostridium chauvoei TaxID=46867 RepID=S6F9J5_9CLOT|nr:nicotinate phosphoribosyltransferase [Clostridium chauvoei]ATD55070.1 nicotinate phosphoribosyltransferase [Clostridium chauvoei]ATD57256.1 nicotinate phosphoribosyltransferase [Clostridium chauvoei]MBX7279412.1 nicotinate phosphoribosyltransferase [Clostridium chauvoei]MBX7282502.1 nicotinate phosphoribosyltransferase [Clostridium chauvoei]MBX7285611.1 nicotinate phosphoribosyltransferase [Clostridium chauvoei]